MIIESQTAAWVDLPLEGQEHADIIVYGKVTKIDPGRWNSPDGNAWDLKNYKDNTPNDTSDDPIPVIYRTYYVEPTETLKGTPKWGTPIVFIVDGGTEQETVGPVSVGDTVMILAIDYQSRGGRGSNVYWKKDAYFAINGDSNVFVLKSGTLIKSEFISSDGKNMVSTLGANDRGAKVDLKQMREAIKATKEGKKIDWYPATGVTTTTEIGSKG
jgi:hypothetical protein